MPVFRQHAVLEVARNVKAFLKLEVGLTRGNVPAPEQQERKQAEELQKAHARLREQSRQIERLRERLSKKNERITASPDKPDATSMVNSGADQISFPAKKHERRLVVLDDVFPHVLSPFRIAEFNSYLRTWEDAVVCTTTSSFSLLGETRSFEQVLREYAARYPQFEERVFAVGPKQSLADYLAGDELVYTMFLHNAYRFLSIVHEYDLPFVFTLYPGGRFRLDQEESDRQLREVCSSPNFEKVIVTQKASRNYLTEKGFCAPTKIEFIYGGVFPSERLPGVALEKRRYREHKDTFDVCFVAHKYTRGGVDKGYDVFVEVAKLLSRTHEDVFFHVVGPFDESDVDVSGSEGRIAFYGTRPTEFFRTFYSGMDIILSPNVPFALAPGAFDGFPTGGCIEAGLSGVAVFCTDLLEQNIAFKDGEEIVIIPRDARAICETIDRYHARPEDLYELAARGQKAFRKVFGVEAQMEPRLRILSELLGNRTSAPIRKP